MPMWAVYKFELGQQNGKGDKLKMNAQELKLECLKLAKEIHETNALAEEVVKDANIFYDFINKK